MTDQEKNEAIAKRLGWVQCCNPMTMENGKIVDCFGWSKGGSHFHEIYPNYLNDIRAAWEVVEHLKSLNESCHLTVTYNNQIGNGGWAFDFWNPNKIDGINQTKITALSDTAPRAICEAFLKLP